MLRVEHADTQLYGRARGRSLFQQSRRLRLHSRSPLRPARQLEQPVAALLGGLVAQRAGHVFLDRARQIVLAFFNGSGLIAEQSRLRQPLASLAHLRRCGSKVKVIPKHSRRLQIAVCLARMHLGHARPVRRSLVHAPAIGVDVANPRQRVQIVRLDAQQALLDCDSLVRIFRMEVSQRAIERRRLPSQRFIGRVLGCQRIGRAHALFKARLPQTRLQPESLRCRIGLRQRGPVRLVDLRSLLPQRRQLRIQPAAAAEQLKQLVAQIR